MWVRAYRTGLMETKAERQNKDLKNEYLNQYKDNSLRGMITVVIVHFLPDKFRK